MVDKRSLRECRVVQRGYPIDLRTQLNVRNLVRDQGWKLFVGKAQYALINGDGLLINRWFNHVVNDLCCLLLLRYRKSIRHG